MWKNDSFSSRYARIYEKHKPSPLRPEEISWILTNRHELFSLLKFNQDLSRKSSQVLKDKWILAVQRLSVATRLITLLVAQQLNCTRWKYANAWYNFYVYLLRLAIKKNVVQLWNGIENSSLPRSHNCIGFRREGNVSPKVSMFTVTHTTYSMGIKSFLNERL